MGFSNVITGLPLLFPVLFLPLLLLVLHERELVEEDPKVGLVDVVVLGEITTRDRVHHDYPLKSSSDVFLFFLFRSLFNFFVSLIAWLTE
jgi:hypothetical protein